MAAHCIGLGASLSASNCRHNRGRTPVSRASLFARGAVPRTHMLRSAYRSRNPQGRNARKLATESRIRNTEEALGCYEDDLLSQPVNYGTRRVAPIFVVEQVMSIPKVLNENTPVRDAVNAFMSEDVSHFPVVSDDNRLVGVLSVSDILWYEAKYEGVPQEQAQSCHRLYLKQNCETAFMHNQLFLASRVKDSMARKPITVTPNVLLSEATSLMLTKKIHFLPVVPKHGPNAGDVVGILTRSDIMRCMASALLI